MERGKGGGRTQIHDLKVCQTLKGSELEFPGSGRSPGEGNGNPLQYSSLGNFMDKGAWGGLQSTGSQKSQTQLGTSTTTTGQRFYEPSVLKLSAFT